VDAVANAAPGDGCARAQPFKREVEIDEFFHGG